MDGEGWGRGGAVAGFWGEFKRGEGEGDTAMEFVQKGRRG